MSSFERLNRVPWWMWAPILVPAVVVLTVALGWFPVVAAIVGLLMMKLMRAQPGKATSLEVAELVGRPQDITKSVLAEASNQQLCRLWTQSSGELRRAYLPASISSYVWLRQALLEEMERRDAEAVDRWLADGPDRRDPRGYLEQR